MTHTDTDWTQFEIVNNSRMTVLQMLVTKTQPPLNSNSPPVAVTEHMLPKNVQFTSY